MAPNRLVFVAAMLFCSSTACNRVESPDIILITVDTLRADRLGCYGHAPARTPNIDRLAAEGIRVERAIAPTPLTLPSHTSIMTGLEPPAHGVRDNGTFRVPDAAQTLAERLQAEGYQTQAFVSAGVLDRKFNLNQGFEGYDDALWSEAAPDDFMLRERSGERTMDRVLEWLGERSERATARAPLFLWVHLFDPHNPYNPPEEDAANSPTPYDGEIASVDRQIGRLVQALREEDGLEDAIVVFTSDHGESLGEHSEETHSIFIYESTVRVPLIFRYPRKLPAGGVYAGPARSVDIMPTVLGLAGVEPNETQGADLSAALIGGPAAPSAPQYSESLHPELAFGMAPLEGIRLDEWTYIRAPRAELYDRAADPRETRNLLEVGDPDAATARAAALEALLTEIGEDGKRFGVVPEPRPLDAETAEMLRSLGYLGDADAAENLEGMDPKDGLPIIDAVKRAIASTQADDCEAAAALLTSVLERLPSHVRARNTLAMCEARAGDLAAARANYLVSLAHEPQQPHIHLRIGQIDIAEGRHESARRQISRALELLPGSTEAMMLMGALEFGEGHPKKAKRWYDEAIAADPTRPDAYLQLGDHYFREQKFEKARAWYEKALGASPGNYAASLQAGLSALYLGDSITAERHLLRANRAEPTRWQPLYGLACARTQRDDPDAALGYLEDAAAHGFANVDQLQRNPCLTALSNEPRFVRLVGALGGTATP